MVILSSSGFEIKQKCDNLLKLVKNKKVFICTNAIDRQIYATQKYNTIRDIAIDVVDRLEVGELTEDNSFKFTEYYDCIFLAEGNLRKLGDMLNHKKIKDSLLNYVKNGKMLITEGLSCHIVTDNLEYLSYIMKSLDDNDEVYKFIDYAQINTLALTKEKFIVHSNALAKKFKGACHLAERNYRMTITHLNDGEIKVL